MSSSILIFRGRTALLTAVAALAAVVVSLSAIARAPEFTLVSASPSVSIHADNSGSGDTRFYAYRDRAGDAPSRSGCERGGLLRSSDQYIDASRRRESSSLADIDEFWGQS